MQGDSGHVRAGVPYEWRNYGPGSSQQAALCGSGGNIMMCCAWYNTCALHHIGLGDKLTSHPLNLTGENAD